MGECDGIILIAGYGGHSGYAFAVAYELFRLGFQRNIIVVAEGYEFLVEKFKPYGEVVLQTLPRKPAEPLYRGLGRWVKAFWQSAKLASKYRVNTVFAGGSNFSIPLTMTSKILNTSKIYTIEAIEHFTTRSRTVRLLEDFGGTVLLHWEEQLEIFPKGVVVGPVYEPPLYEAIDRDYVLVTTGTLGYKELFDCIEKLGFKNVVLQSGDIDPHPYVKRNPSWVAFRYTSDIHKLLAGASLVIAQQGVTASIARLAYRKPTIITWNPRVTLGASRQDVRIYAEKLEVPLVEEVSLNALRNAVDNVKPLTKTYHVGSLKVANMLLHCCQAN